MNMRLRGEFRLLAIGSLLALMAAFALAVSGTPSAAAAALSQASFESDFGEARLPRGAVPAALEAPVPDVAPHAAASLFILFRNLRE